jgi:hypothetical protein
MLLTLLWMPSIEENRGFKPQVGRHSYCFSSDIESSEFPSTLLFGWMTLTRFVHEVEITSQDRA